MQEIHTSHMSWDAGHYDQSFDFVTKYGEDVLHLLHAQAGETILDVGCGTGSLTDLISKTGAIVTGIDSSEEMIARAKQKFSTAHFEAISITSYVKENFFDAIFSNAALHWIPEKEQVAQNMFYNLKPGGRLVLEMGGKGNMEGVLTALYKILSKHGFEDRATLKPWYFPSIAAYTTVLEAVGFEVKYAMLFERDTELKNINNGMIEWISMFGKSFLKDLEASVQQSILQETQELLRKTHFKNNKWYADYVRLRVVAHKPNDKISV